MRTPAAARAVLAALVLCATALGVAAPSRSFAEPTRTLRLAIWSNYLPAEVLADFEKEARCRVEIPWNYGSSDELVARLRAKDTGFDLVVPTDAVLPGLVASGLLEPLDVARLPGRTHLDPAFAKRPADPEGAWSVPYAWGTIGIAWRSDKIEGEIDSWGVFGTDRGRGNAFLLEEARDPVAAALLFRGHSSNSTDPKHLAEAKATLLAWKRKVRGFTGEVKDHLLSGEAWLLQAYNGDAAQAQAERPGVVRFAVPKEGGVLWADSFVIPKGAPSKALAHEFLEYLLRPAVAARISGAIRYATCNKDALPLVPAAVRDDPVVYAPADVRKRLEAEKDLGAGLRAITDLWAEVRGD